MMPERIYSGVAVVIGDDIDTDAILPGKYLALTDPALLAPHLFEGADLGITYGARRGIGAPAKLTSDSIIVAGKNFGCGSSREGAPLAFLGVGIRVIVAESFGRIFWRNSINLGLLPLECPGLPHHTKTGDRLEVNTKTGKIRNLSSGNIFTAREIPAIVRKIIDSGGLVNLVRKELGANNVKRPNKNSSNSKNVLEIEKRKMK
jgi:3-isopropylmalate/(R)-2-methylmalate dehydratase small subunit